MSQCDELKPGKLKPDGTKYIEELELNEDECQLLLVAQRTLELLGLLIRLTDLPNMRTEQEALVVSYLAQPLFAELLAHSQSDDNDP